MNVPEPIIVGKGRYRVHAVCSGLHLAYQVEWQRDFKALRRERFQTSDGKIIEYLSLPPWESAATLFAEVHEAAAFAVAVLESRVEPAEGTHRRARGRRTPSRYATV